MNTEEFRKLSTDKKIMFLLNRMEQRFAKVDEDIGHLKILAGCIEPLKTQVAEMRAYVNANSDSVAGLSTRMDELDARLANLQEPAVAPEADGNIKEEEVTVNGDLPRDYMPGTQRIFESIVRRNQAINQDLNHSMPWQRTAGASGVPGGEEKPRMVLSGSHTILGGSLHHEDKVIKLWELARVDAKDNIFNSILMWWPAIAEVKAEEFNTINWLD